MSRRSNMVRQRDVPDGDFEQEIARTRQNAKLMALLDERARQMKTVPLKEVKRPLGLDEVQE